MNVRKRLEELERRFHADEQIRLEMEDGSVKMLRLKPGEDLCDLLARGMQELNVGNELSPDISSIKKSISSTEPGGGRMIELLSALLNGPVGSDELDAIG
jgi:hypothetical protein